MPLVRISFNDETTREHRRAIADGVYEAMRETLDIPEGDRFQILTGHAREDFIMDPDFLGIERTRDAVLIQIFLSRGRSVETKQALYRRISERVRASPGIRPQDIMVVLTEVGLEDWSFGNGEAQYVLNPPRSGGMGRPG